MKKHISILLAAFLLLSLFVGAVGCSKSEKPVQQVTQQENEPNKENTVSKEDISKPEGEVKEEKSIQTDNNNENITLTEENSNTTEENNEVVEEGNQEEEAQPVEQEQTQPQEEKCEEDTQSVDTEYVTFVDYLGETVKIKKNPKKVISLYNSFTNIWYSAGGEVIGRIDSTSQLTQKALKAEVCGSMGTPNVEKILSLQPDLILLAPNIDGQANIIPLLKENKIPYLALQYDSYDEYFVTLKLFTDITGRQDLYQEIGEKIKNEVNSIIAKVPKDKKPTVLLLFGSTRSVQVKLPSNNFVGAMLQELGAVNIAVDSKLTESEMQIFSMERVLEKDPDFIFTITMGSDLDKIKARIAEETSANPAWGSLTAVKEGRYIILPKELYLYKPNERYAEAYRGLAKILYPQVFK